MTAYTSFRVVNDDLRKLATQGKWSNVIAQLTLGRTLFIPVDDSRGAANALSQSMRVRGYRLRRKTTDIPDDKGVTSRGTLFWAEKALGN